MSKAMEILEGKNPTPETNGDIELEKKLVKEAGDALRKIHDEDVQAGLTTKFNFTSDTAKLADNLIVYANEYMKSHPGIVVYSVVAYAIKTNQLPMNQRSCPGIKEVMKLHNQYIIDSIDNDELRKQYEI